VRLTRRAAALPALKHCCLASVTRSLSKTVSVLASISRVWQTTFKVSFTRGSSEKLQARPSARQPSQVSMGCLQTWSGSLLRMMRQSSHTPLHGSSAVRQHCIPCRRQSKLQVSSPTKS
jgi:hypothetical protein